MPSTKPTAAAQADEPFVAHGSFSIERAYPASPERVFAAFRDPVKKRRARANAAAILKADGNAARERFRRQPADMRRHHDIGQAEKPIVLRCGLALKHVQPCCPHMAASERVTERGLVNEATARSVDKKRLTLHQREFWRSNHVACLWR